MIKIRSLLAPVATLALLSLAACSSSSDEGNTAGNAGGGGVQEDPSTGVKAEDGSNSNPDGVPYPTTNIGTNKGQTIKNYKFVGYPDGDKAKGLQPVALADYFDPTGEKYKLIHIQAAGSWCKYCKEEIVAAQPIADQIASRKVVWILSLAEGKVTGTPSTVDDLDAWMKSYATPFTHVVDPGNKNLGPFYDAAALPWNANINAKTMEILSAGVGATVTGDKILADLDKDLAKVQ